MHRQLGGLEWCATHRARHVYDQSQVQDLPRTVFGLNDRGFNLHEQVADRSPVLPDEFPVKRRIQFQHAVISHVTYPFR